VRQITTDANVQQHGLIWPAIVDGGPFVYAVRLAPWGPPSTAPGHHSPGPVFRSHGWSSRVAYVHEATVWRLSGRLGSLQTPWAEAAVWGNVGA
jgi:hypothetical protein